MLHSIQNILQVYETGDNPVMVECNDLNTYICKHNRGITPSKKLFAEWMGHALLAGMNVSVAPRELVRVKEDHVEPTHLCQPRFFKDSPTFATQFLEEALEWNHFNLKNVKQIVNKEDILKIAFFDLWTANEDRNWNNFNLLTNPLEKGWELIPIDHGACFNSLSFEEGRSLFQITEDESIISTEEFCILVGAKVKNMKKALDFINSLYLCIPDLEKLYDEQVIAIPEEWRIPESYHAALRENLFSKEWLNETKTQFLSLIKSSLKLK